MASKPLRLVSVAILLLEGHRTQLLSLHVHLGVTVFLSGVCTFWDKSVIILNELVSDDLMNISNKGAYAQGQFEVSSACYDPSKWPENMTFANFPSYLLFSWNTSYIFTIAQHCKILLSLSDEWQNQQRQKTRPVIREESGFITSYQIKYHKHIVMAWPLACLEYQ